MSWTRQLIARLGLGTTKQNPKETLAEATALLAEGEGAAARDKLCSALEDVLIPASDYTALAQLLLDCTADTAPSFAVAACFYLRDAATLAWLASENPLLQARAARLAGRWRDAAAAYESAGKPAHAAVLLERNREFADALARWELVKDLPTPYLSGLGAANRSRCADLSGASPASEYGPLALSLLERAAVEAVERKAWNACADAARALFHLGVDQRNENVMKRAQELYEQALTGAGAAPSRLDSEPLVELRHEDLLEWERGVSPSDVAQELLLDGALHDYLRRQAFVLLLALAKGSSDVVVAERVGEVRMYACCGVLEALYEKGSPEVRAAAVRATRFLLFLRSFVLLHRGLQDPVDAVREAAVEALAAQSYAQAVPELRALHQNSELSAVRAAALQALGKTDALAAVEYLRSLRAHADWELARQALARSPHPAASAETTNQSLEAQKLVC